MEVSNWKSTDRESEIRHFAYNWYRSFDGKDQSKFGDYYIGEVIASQVLHGLYSLNRYYETFSECLLNGRTVPYFNDASRLENLVAGAMGVKASAIKRLYVQEDETAYVAGQMPIAPMSRIFRKLQRPIRRYLTGKDLFITDWTTQYFARNQRNTLVLFRKSLNRGAVTLFNASEVRKMESFFPEALEFVGLRKHVDNYLNSSNYSWQPQLIEIFLNYMEIKYQEIRSQLMLYASLWEELLDFYEPRKVSLPIDAIPMWILLLRACEIRNIETTCFLDGYPTIPNWPVSRNHDNSNWSANNFAAFDDSHRLQLIERGVKAEHIVMTGYPAQCYFEKNNRDKTKKYDVIIMTYWPNVFSSLSDYSSPPQTLRTILESLSQLKNIEIGIKVRTLDEVDYVKTIANELDIRVSVLTGKFYSHIGSTKLVVTGISSAVYECQITGTDVLVFEPIDNGYSDELVATSKIVRQELFCRTKSDLTQKLQLYFHKT